MRRKSAEKAEKKQKKSAYPARAMDGAQKLPQVQQRRAVAIQQRGRPKGRVKAVSAARGGGQHRPTPWPRPWAAQVPRERDQEIGQGVAKAPRPAPAARRRRWASGDVLSY